MKSKSMLNWAITLSWFVMFTSCDRNSQDEGKSVIFEDHRQINVPPQTSVSVPSLQKPVETTSKLETEKKELISNLREISASTCKGGEFTSEGLEQLVALIPHLKDAGLLWSEIGVVMPHQIEKFREVILSSLYDLSYEDQRFYFNLDIKNAYSVAEKLEDPEVARVALAQLTMVKPYQYPKGILPTRSPSTLEAGEHLCRGHQGILAKNVVMWGDETTIDKFRKILNAASPDSQRVFIWAMGRSRRLEDFEFLMELRKKTSSPEIFDTLVRALNRIPREMDTLANYPESISLRYRPKDPQVLLATSRACYKLLEEEKLIVELTIYD